MPMIVQGAGTLNRGTMYYHYRWPSGGCRPDDHLNPGLIGVNLLYVQYYNNALYYNMVCWRTYISHYQGIS